MNEPLLGGQQFCVDWRVYWPSILSGNLIHVLMLSVSRSMYALLSFKSFQCLLCAAWFRVQVNLVFPTERRIARQSSQSQVCDGDIPRTGVVWWAKSWPYFSLKHCAGGELAWLIFPKGFGEPQKYDTVSTILSVLSVFFLSLVGNCHVIGWEADHERTLAWGWDQARNKQKRTPLPISLPEDFIVRTIFQDRRMHITPLHVLHRAYFTSCVVMTGRSTLLLFTLDILQFFHSRFLIATEIRFFFSACLRVVRFLASDCHSSLARSMTN